MGDIMERAKALSEMLNDGYSDSTEERDIIDRLLAEIERLEAAFLEQFVQGIQAPREMAELMAREALARIKEGKG